MIKIKVIRETKFKKIMFVGETGTYLIEDVKIKIGKDIHDLWEIEHYKEWSRFGKINNCRRFDIKVSAREEKLLKILSEYTDKQIKDIDKIQWNITVGYEYKQRGSKNFEGIQISA